MTVFHRMTPSRSAARAGVRSGVRSGAQIAGLVLAVGSLTACSSLDGLLGNEKIDYRSTGTKTPGLEVPPDLTQLARDSRYQTPQGGTISATTFQTGAAAAAPVSVSNDVAPKAIGDIRIERDGSTRWLSTGMPPDQIWPQLQAFWKERGFTLAVDQPAIGVMETEWAENRAKLPVDIIRSTIGRVFDSLYSTGERDKFRTRVERTASGGSEVFIAHRGMVEVYSGTQRESTVWQPRPADATLEGEFLQRLLVKLGVKEEQAKTAVASAGSDGAPVARARTITGQAAATLTVDDGFDRAWRRVGLALDRSGFTVEDRDRSQGLYFVRYIDPANAGKEEPGFFGKLFSFGKSDTTGPVRYRVLVKGDNERTTVSVQNGQGGPENGEAGTRIVRLLVQDLK